VTWIYAAVLGEVPRIHEGCGWAMGNYCANAMQDCMMMAKMARTTKNWRDPFMLLNKLICLSSLASNFSMNSYCHLDFSSISFDISGSLMLYAKARRRM
jgi:hypothetical protein